MEKLYRIIVRQRVQWVLGYDTSVPESIKPPEVEDRSIERDVTDFVADFTRQHQREALSAEATFTIINERGTLTPSNVSSEYNWIVIEGLRTYAPLFGEGNEIQIYRIPTAELLTTSNEIAKVGWIPRFRGVISSVTATVSEGTDQLEVVAGDALSRAPKRAFSASWSPVVRTGSFIPCNSFYDLSRLTDAIAMFRNVNGSSVMIDPAGSRAGHSIEEPGMIPTNLLASMIFWDREDYYYRKGKDILGPYFNKPHIDAVGEFEDDPALNLRSNIAVNASTATGVFMLNGRSWFVAAGSVSKNSADVFQSPEGSMTLTGATLRTEVYKVPLSMPSVLKVPVRLSSGQSVSVTVSPVTFDTAALQHGSVGSSIASATITGPTSFDAATTLGGTVLNTDLTSALEWRVLEVQIPAGAIPSTIYHGDADFLGLNPTGRGGSSTILTLLRVEIAGSGSVDSPRWEFTSIDKDPVTESAIIVDNNILSHPVMERWTTTDGIVFRDPYSDHKALTKKMIRVIVRNLACPYASGTDKGFAPVHMYNRALPSEWMYERDLVEGSDFEVLYDKGAIRLSIELLRGEVWVAHTAVDLAASQHMEATNLIRKLLTQGAGIPEYQSVYNPGSSTTEGSSIFTPSTIPNIQLEPTGIILSRVNVDVAANGSILQALRDIMEQMPVNYHLYADGDAHIIGRFIQQNGSPRIYNPVVQTPITPTGDFAVGGKEAWYAVSAITKDGRETLPSNLVSTVEYQNYYDAEHKSIIDGASSVGLRIRPVPNQVALVVRRAFSSKPADEQDIEVDKLAPVGAWYFTGSYGEAGSGLPLTSASGKFRLVKLVDIAGAAK